MKKLRDYQVKAINDIKKTWESGEKNILMVLPTGSGKSLVIAEILKKNKGNAILCAHRAEIICQLSLTLASLDVYHNIITSYNTVWSIAQTHKQVLGSDKFLFGVPSVTIVSIDAMRKQKEQWYQRNNFNLLIIDEGHHVLRKNKWGIFASNFNDINSLLLTATPVRSDRKGLCKSLDGIIDKMIVGPSTSSLIKQGFLVDYKIYAPKCKIDLSEVSSTASGDYNIKKLQKAVHESTITGDIVKHYKKIANGKKAVVFTVSREENEIICNEFNNEGIKARVIDGETNPIVRSNIIQEFKNGDIKILVNVDILGEGTDVPEMEVVIMARPTKSLGLYLQQFGRCLRPAPGKTHGIVIDHVNNVMSLGLPDDDRKWSLEHPNQSSYASHSKIKICTNDDCRLVYNYSMRSCPNCTKNNESMPEKKECTYRKKPIFIEEDLELIDKRKVQLLRNEINKINKSFNDPAPSVDKVKKQRYDNNKYNLIISDLVKEWMLYFPTESKKLQIFKSSLEKNLKKLFTHYVKDLFLNYEESRRKFTIRFCSPIDFKSLKISTATKLSISIIKHLENQI